MSISRDLSVQRQHRHAAGKNKFDWKAHNIPQFYETNDSNRYWALQFTLFVTVFCLLSNNFNVHN